MMYSKEEYENEPVHFCANCLSLNIKELQDVKLDICRECGNTDIHSSSMEQWTKKYAEEYGRTFMTDEYDEIEE